MRKSSSNVVVSYENDIRLQRKRPLDTDHDYWKIFMGKMRGFALHTASITR
jgi:hypothetical protein